VEVCLKLEDQPLLMFAGHRALDLPLEFVNFCLVLGERLLSLDLRLGKARNLQGSLDDSEARGCRHGSIMKGTVMVNVRWFGRGGV
jgi:hypothetical protein